MPELRNYQEQGVADIRARFADGERRVLYQAPTGSGKTVLFAYVVAVRGRGATASSSLAIGTKFRQISDALRPWVLSMA